MGVEKENELASWLRDAQAVKAGFVTILEKQAEETSYDTRVQSEIREYLEETKRHVRMMESCVRKYNEMSPIRKRKFNQAKFLSRNLNVGMLGVGFVRDVYGSYVARRFDVVSYQTIKEAAKDLGDKETVKACDKILKDERKTRDWLLAVEALTKAN
ncbi:MAG: DUF892 family protein [Candidatus Paceibacterota bacterium]